MMMVTMMYVENDDDDDSMLEYEKDGEMIAMTMMDDMEIANNDVIMDLR